MRFAVIIMLATLTCGRLFALDETAELRAIALKEDSHGKIGAKGERGDWQMKPCNVTKYGGYEYMSALSMMRAIEAELKKRGEKVDAFTVALCWKMGVHGAIDGHPTMADYQYALEVQSNYYRLIH